MFRFLNHSKPVPILTNSECPPARRPNWPQKFRFGWSFLIFGNEVDFEEVFQGRKLATQKFRPPKCSFKSCRDESIWVIYNPRKDSDCVRKLSWTIVRSSNRCFYGIFSPLSPPILRSVDLPKVENFFDGNRALINGDRCKTPQSTVAYTRSIHPNSWPCAVERPHLYGCVRVDRSGCYRRDSYQQKFPRINWIFRNKNCGTIQSVYCGDSFCWSQIPCA